MHARRPPARKTRVPIDLNMTRIFLGLAVVNGLTLVAAFALGIASWLLRGSASHASVYLTHLILGLTGSILTLLVHCLIFTYFLGTGRWVKEVGIAYQLPDRPLPKLTRDLKRRTFPPALAAMLVTIAATAAGGGVQMRGWPWYVHGLLAVLALAVNAAAFLIEYRSVRTNGEIIDQVLVEVDRIRAAHGLPSNLEALAQQEGERRFPTPR
jgi:hypothetical protein